MDNKDIEYNKEKLRDNMVMALISNFNKPGFLEGLPNNLHIFNKEEIVLIDYFKANPTKPEEFKDPNYMKMCKSVIQEEIDRLTKEREDREEKESWMDLKSRGLGGITPGSDNVFMESETLEDMVGDSDLDQLLDMDLIQGDLEDMFMGEDSIQTNYSSQMIDAKLLLLDINGYNFDMYFIDNKSKSLRILGKEPHNLAFLWTFPELKPVMNMPAFIKLFENNEIQDCQVAMNHKDPNMIEYKLLKGLLALEMGGAN